jgi:hypothetical protein
MIDLAMSYEETMPSLPEKDDVHYPSFHVESDEKLDIPEEGEMTIKYKKVSSAHSERNGNEHYSCTIEVLGIVSTDGKKVKSPAKSGNEAESALDDLMKAAMKHKAAMEKSEDY